MNVKIILDICKYFYLYTCFNTSACLYMIRLGKLQDFFLQKAILQSATLQRAANHFCSLLKLFLYFRGELLQLSDRDQLMIIQVLINLRNYRPMPKGVGM